MNASTGYPESTTLPAIAFFERLRALARLRPERIAIVSPERTATYRKLWSRVERATARLQGEWGVAAGHTVALAGPPHPDALVLWLALCRLGAALLTREDDGGPERRQTPPLPDDLRHAVTLQLHVDGGTVSRLVEGIADHPLSAIIGRPCAHREIVRHEDGSLICLREAGGGAWSLDALLRAAGPMPAIARVYGADDVDLRVQGPVLQAAELTARVLPALMAGRRIVYPHAEEFAPAHSLR